nr:TerB family tellurite resistance protein [Gammaproteobacteria bacterium]
KNTIYFQVIMELRDRGITFDLPDLDIRKLCLAAGLMARVAGIDRVVSPEETKVMSDVLQRRWSLTEEQAQLVAEISHHRIFRGLDGVRLVKRFKDLTTRTERQEFLHCLFEVANAADQTALEEIEEIRSIARGMDLTHQDFLDAKLVIPREERGGL